MICCWTALLSLALPKTEDNQKTSIPTLFITLASSTGWLVDLLRPAKRLADAAPVGEDGDCVE